MKISEIKIKKALDKAYKEAGSHAYFGNGFNMGVEFALNETSDNPIQNIDFELLKKQKGELVSFIAKSVEEKTNLDMVETLSGLLGLVDNIQDFAVDELGMNENEIFDFEEV